MGSQTWLPPKWVLPRSAACGSLGSKIRGGPLTPAHCPLGQESSSTMTKDVHPTSCHPNDRRLPPSPMAGSFQKEPIAPCNAQGGTHLAPPGHRRAAGLSPESVRPKGANGTWTVGAVQSWSPSLTWAWTSPDARRPLGLLKCRLREATCSPSAAGTGTSGGGRQGPPTALTGPDPACLPGSGFAPVTYHLPALGLIFLHTNVKTHIPHLEFAHGHLH